MKLALVCCIYAHHLRGETDVDPHLLWKMSRPVELIILIRAWRRRR